MKASTIRLYKYGIRLELCQKDSTIRIHPNLYIPLERKKTKNTIQSNYPTNLERKTSRKKSNLTTLQILRQKRMYVPPERKKTKKTRSKSQATEGDPGVCEIGRFKANPVHRQRKLMINHR